MYQTSGLFSLLKKSWKKFGWIGFGEKYLARVKTYLSSGFGGARPSFMNSILNPMLNTAIDNLSDSDSDLDDYTMDKVKNKE